MNLPTLARSTFLAAAAIALSLFALKSFALDSSLPPGGNFDLLGWYLNTPEADPSDGESRRIDEVDLDGTDGFVDSDYFWTAADGGMVFRVTNAGATTSPNTAFTRTELREMLRRGDTSINTRNSDGTPNLNNWVFSSAPQSAQNAAGGIDGKMEATLAVNAVTTTGRDSRVGRVVVGQIHARDDEPLRLYYRKLPGNQRGSIYAAHEPSGGDDIYYEILGSRDNDAPDPAEGIELDEVWSFEVLVIGNQQTVTIRSGDLDGPIIGTAVIDMSGSGYDVSNDFMYFRAGAYNQNNTEDGGLPNDFAQVTFYALDVDHGIDIELDPNDSATVVNDSFADGDRTSTGVLDADWWSSSQASGSNVEISSGALGLVTGTSGRGMHATFEPQTLELGDSISVTYSFTTPATIGVDQNTAFRVALMDLNDPGLAADLVSSSSSSNPLYVGQPGYFTAFDVDPSGGGSQDIGFRKHNVDSAIGRFLGTTGEWDSLGSSSDAGYSFAPNTDYVGVYTITRTGSDNVQLFSSLSLASGAVLDSHTVSDTVDIANNFGMLGFWVNSGTFGSSNVAGNADNGLIFTNVVIQSTVEGAGAGTVSTGDASGDGDDDGETGDGETGDGETGSGGTGGGSTGGGDTGGGSTGGGSTSLTIIDDSLGDGDRTSTGALDANWWSSSQTSGSNVQTAAGALTLVTGTSGRGMHATFAPQTLEEGDIITATYSFTTPATIGTTVNSFRIALMDLNDPGLAADQSSSSSSVNQLYVGQPGYFTAFDVDSVATSGQNTEFRKHDVLATSGRFLGTTGEWNSLGSSPDAGYAFAPNTDYVGVFSITRTGPDSVELFSALMLPNGTVLDGYTISDTSDIANNFGMLGFWVNSNTFGSSNSAGNPDNGLTFTNVLIESTVGAEEPVNTNINIPIVPFWGFMLLGLSLVGMQQLRTRRV